MSADKGFTAKKAMFLNMAQDGLKLRANKFENKKAYKRKAKHAKREW